MCIRALLLGMLTVSFALQGCSDGGSGGASEIQEGTTIEVASGLVEGEVVEGVRRFLGIPFAAPPLGALRWRPPAPVDPWEGVRAARTFSAACPQVPTIVGVPSEDEDCLYLNVWTPEPAPERPLPVMVWFHGGGNETGSASEEVPFVGGGIYYDGRKFAAEHGVVLVTTNYRLGIFGFFAHPDLADENPSRPYTGNQGLLDQRSALRWVQQNIASFGGDPENVTAFGQSAGGTDVCLHLVSPASAGLFHRAISQSGGCTTRQRTAAEFAPDAARVAAGVGCEGAADELACLRGRPVAELLEVAATLVPGGLAPPVLTPVVDGGFLPDQPRALFDRGAFAQVPWLIGSTSDEGTLFYIGAPPLTPLEYEMELATTFGDLGAEIRGAYPADRFDSPRAAMARAFGDFLLVCSTLDSARRAARGGAPVYLYDYDFPVQTAALQPLMLGATHGAEISGIFGSVEPASPDAAVVAGLLQGYWAQHARSGDPNGAERPEWAAFEGEVGPRLRIGPEPQMIDAFRREECAFWDGVYAADFRAD